MPVYQFRNACITDHNVREYNWDEMKPKIKYLAYAEETCPTTGKKHLQGFACGWKQMGLTAWKKLFPGAHIEPMRGQIRENTAYCSKEGNLVEFGEKPNENGVRNDFKEFTDRIVAGERVEKIGLEPDMRRVFVQYRGGLRDLEHYAREVRFKTDRVRPKVYILVGQSGAGKTRFCDEQFGLDGWARMPNPTSSWWITPAVSHSSAVLIDDVGPGKVPKVEEFLEWTDRYPVEFNCKGGFLWWKPKHIVITSNLSWTEWWPNISDHHKVAVEGRIYQIGICRVGHPIEWFNGGSFEELSGI